MSLVYHWLGFTVFWSALIALNWFVLWLLCIVIAACWRRLLREWDWLNYRWYYLLDIVQWYVLGKSRKMSADSVHRVVYAFQQPHHRARLKKAAPFRRDFVAMLARYYRHQKSHS